MKYLIFALIPLLLACDKTGNKLAEVGYNGIPFELVSGSESGVTFVNEVKDREGFNVLTYRNYYNGGGVAIGDINNDGLNDIYFTANMSPNKLYLNKGDMKFEDISEAAGVVGKSSWSTGVTFADVNADGLLDIYVCYSGDAAKENKENELFLNNGDLTFTERAAEFGLNDSGLSTHAAFFDYDLDGDLDCFVLNNSYKDPERISLISRNRFDYNSSGGDRLYRNDGGRFTNITEESKIYSSDIGFGLGISVGDVNNDLYPDLYISNDFWERDYLYINQKDGTFKDELIERIPYTSVSSMGSDIADINNDGTLDIFTTDMLPPDNYRVKAATKFDEYYQFDLKYKNSYYYQFIQNCLQINSADGQFTESAYFSGVGATDWSWGALIFDMNMDGLKDLFVSNGIYHDITDSDFIEFISDREQIKKVVEEKGRYDFSDFVEYLPNNQRKNYAFINQSGNQFVNLSEGMALDQPSYSNGSAYGDLDNDGDFDLVVNNVNMEAFVYQNKAVESGKNYLKIKLNGSEQNPKGIGTKVFVYQNELAQNAHSLTARGFQSSVDPDLIFGFPSSEKIDSIRIIWPGGKSQLLREQAVNQILSINIEDATEMFSYPSSQSGDFGKIETQMVHTENLFIDYDQDRLLPHMLSAEGPQLIKGDVNNDGKEDLILPGAKGFADQLFIQTSSGFVIKKSPAFELEKEAEIVCGALFDADGDGDMDYLAGTGGNEPQSDISVFTTKFYLNDGKGNFTKEAVKGPEAKGQFGCIKPQDIDNDGDLDLFLGASSIPGAYGLSPRSYVLRNDGGGAFTDVTSEHTGPIGMVKDAVWADVNADQLPDLIVIGEWMPVTIFINNQGSLEKGLEVPMSHGWWNSIKAADYDGDGDTDFLLGNWGENMKIKASEKRPVKLYINDFDGNQRPDIIMEWFSFEDQKPYPFATKMDLTTQMPSLKKSILKYQDYAQKQVGDIFPEDALAKSTQRVATNFSTSVLKNTPDGLVLEPLQAEAQLSPVFAIEVSDLDKDGITDYILGGNYYRLKPEIGRHDGFKGGYFKGLGNGKFKFIDPQKSGITVKGEVRDLALINDQLVVARNNDKILIFEKK
ncbi:VCBS repeat-containing protein [Jiulongibacter sediminis]|uniref:VCBS repeat-containing protein n=1 Tax=Jiulongibacter sediminis TaxID=1605367 RepID=UPI0026EC618A|nr:VCBS repeat-containing protein [Jiulongibacter sediminis]